MKLALPSVTLCAAASVNVAATVAALRASLDQVEFGECLLFTGTPKSVSDPDIRVIAEDGLSSAPAYSDFMLRQLVHHVRTEHCLIVQWDGFVLNAGAWDPAFLSFDYVGAPWPQFDDPYQVGNGGFSLRSRQLLEACLDAGFVPDHPEDLAICRTNRAFLEVERGMRFADRRTAERFAFERTSSKGETFGFHGIFNMVPALGCDRFWQLYSSLDHRRAVRPDYLLLMRQIGECRHSFRKRLRLTADLFRT